MGTETTILDCSITDYENDGTCQGDRLLRCALQPENTARGDLRLVDSMEDDFVISGKLEILGTLWGSVCDLGFDSREATVVCRQLGYYDEGMSRCKLGCL